MLHIVPIWLVCLHLEQHAFNSDTNQQCKQYDSNNTTQVYILSFPGIYGDYSTTQCSQQFAASIAHCLLHDFGLCTKHNEINLQVNGMIVQWCLCCVSYLFNVYITPLVRPSESWVRLMKFWSMAIQKVTWPLNFVSCHLNCSIGALLWSDWP